MGNYNDGNGDGYGLLFYNNGKILFRGVYDDSIPHKKKFFVYYKENGGIDFDKSNF
jgi:antitoxin component YwqK of YwqJK toxin-antitoxin module